MEKKNYDIRMSEGNDIPRELGETLVPDSGPQPDSIVSTPRVSVLLIAFIAISVVVVAYLSGVKK